MEDTLLKKVALTATLLLLSCLILWFGPGAYAAEINKTNEFGEIMTANSI